MRKNRLENLGSILTDFVPKAIWFYFIVLYTIPTSCEATIKSVSSEPFRCTSVGKFKDNADPHQYHQCYFLFGVLSYIHNTCPAKTCFSPQLNYCVSEACKEILVHTELKESLGTPYNCSNKKFECKEEGGFAYEYDSTVYFKCSKIRGKYTSKCYSCNRKRQTCFENGRQACVTCNQM